MGSWFCACALRYQVSDPQEVEVQAIVSPPVCMLGTDLGLSARVASALTTEPSLQTPVGSFDQDVQKRLYDPDLRIAYCATLRFLFVESSRIS